MSMQLTLTYLTDTINLNSAGCAADGFYPQAAGDPDSPVTEQFEIALSGTDAARLAALRKINLWLGVLAKQDYVPGMNGIFLNYAVNGTETAYRARVLGGAALLDSKLDRRWRHGIVRATITLRREPCWKAVTVQDLDLTNSNGTDTELWVYMADDRTPVSTLYRDCTAAFTIAGDTPAPLNLDYRSSAGIDLVGMLAVVNHFYPTWLRPGLEAEAGTGGTKIPASANTSLYSGGYAQSLTLTTTLAKLWEISLQLGEYEKIKGALMMIAAAFPAGAGADVSLQIRLSMNGTVFYTGPVGRINGNTIQLLDTIPLPGIVATYVTNQMTIELWGKRTTTATALVLDCIYLFPCDGYRILTEIGSAVIIYGEHFYDYPENGETYSIERVGLNDIASFDLSGHGELKAFPGSNLLYLLPISTSYNPSTVGEITLRYKPGRDTL